MWVHAVVAATGELVLPWYTLLLVVPVLIGLAVRQDVADLRAMLLLRKAKRALGRDDPARARAAVARAIGLAVRRRRPNVDLCAQIALTAISARMPNDALAIAQLALEATAGETKARPPREVRLLVVAAQACRSNGDAAGAIKYYEAARDKIPDAGRIAERLGPGIETLLGFAMLQNGDFKKALGYANARIRDRSSGDPASEERQASMIGLAASAELKLGNFEEAERLCELAAKTSPSAPVRLRFGRATHLAGLAGTQILLRKLEAAADTLQELAWACQDAAAPLWLVAQIPYTRAGIAWRRGDIRSEQKLLREAHQVLRAAPPGPLGPLEVEMAAALAACVWRAGGTEECTAVLSEIEKAPAGLRLQAARLSAGFCQTLARRGDLQGASENWLAAAAVDPEPATAQGGTARSRIRQELLADGFGHVVTAGDALEAWMRKGGGPNGSHAGRPPGQSATGKQG